MTFVSIQASVLPYFPDISLSLILLHTLCSKDFVHVSCNHEDSFISGGPKSCFGMFSCSSSFVFRHGMDDNDVVVVKTNSQCMGNERQVVGFFFHGSIGRERTHFSHLVV